ncbi:MAG: tyrosine-type recombinase/integrase [Ignavibacteriae bacterium]|nr:tyrosine-type recombinase/integrase [Ignavibacteriota bacterium]
MKLSTLTDYVEKFIASYSDKSKETQGTYQRTLREFVTFFSADRQFQFRVKDVERYKKHLHTTKKMQDVSVAAYMTSLRRLCQYLVESGVIEKNPAKGIQGGRRPIAHARTFLTLNDIELLLNSIEEDTATGLRDKALILTMLGCACAELELTHAEVGDLKKVESLWILNVQGKGKSIKDEPVRVPKATYDALEKYLTNRGKDIPEDSPLFLSYSNRAQGKSMSIRGIRETISVRLKNSNVKRGRDLKLTPFSLRHTAGILMAELGATPEEIMKRMRIEWRPTAMLYFRQKGKLRSEDSPITADLVSVEMNK